MELRTEVPVEGLQSSWSEVLFSVKLLYKISAFWIFRGWASSVFPLELGRAEELRRARESGLFYAGRYTSECMRLFDNGSRF